METFRAYSPEDIILSNLKETSARHACVFEQELAHLAELAKELIEPTADATELLSSLPDFHLSDDAPSDPNHLPQNHKVLHQLGKIHAVEKRTLLCDEIRKLLQNAGIDFSSAYFTENDLKRASPHIRIAYQKNSLTDLAFLQFSKLFDAPHAVYFQSFSAACENVFQEDCDYCILPIENNSEGRLIGFTKLIDRFTLHIASISDVTGTDSTRCTRFALISKNLSFSPLPNKTFSPFLEIAFSPDRENGTTDLLLAAQLCGLSLYRMDSIPDTENENNLLFHTVFRVTDSSKLPTFLLYLSMEVPQHRTVGIYTHLPQKTNS